MSRGLGRSPSSEDATVTILETPPIETRLWEDPLPQRNRAGIAGCRLGILALVAFALYLGSVVFGGETTLSYIIAATMFLSTFVLGVLGIVFGSIGLRTNPKGDAITGLATGIVAVLAIPSAFIAAAAIDSSSSSGGDYSSYINCLTDPYTTYSECKAEFPDH